MAGASALWCRARKGASRGEGEQVNERGKLGCPLLEGIEAGQGGRRTWQWCSAMVGVRPVHGGCVGISSNRWRVMVGARWEPILGWLRANLDLGPKSKVEVYELLYSFH